MTSTNSNIKQKIKTKKRFWKWWHKWIGLVFAFFVIMFCLSGIILNHRNLFKSFDVPRYLLPKGYQIKNYNNGAIKGTLPLTKDSLLCYGAFGCFATDNGFNNFSDCNNGFDKGVDNRKISRIIKDNYGNIIAVAQKDAFVFDTINRLWNKIPLESNNEKLVDVVFCEDTLIILSRSYIYQAIYPYKEFTRIELKVSNEYKKEVSLFKTMWNLHSGELFGSAGKIVVDILGIILIILSLGGIIHFFLPYNIKRSKVKGNNTQKRVKFLGFNLKWHKRIGVYSIVLTMSLAITGMCLRPPLMIPLILNSTPPIKYTILDNKNPFADKLRAIRKDKQTNEWIISTSEGFYKVGNYNTDSVTKINSNINISPMGINVFEQNSDGSWLIGSFSGMLVWNIQSDKIIDYFTCKPYKKIHGRPVGKNMISGISYDINNSPVIFTYDKGALSSLPANPTMLSKQPMSLWNFALEVHTGRIYSVLIGKASDLFIFFAGVIVALILISGYIINRKSKYKQLKHIENTK